MFGTNDPVATLDKPTFGTGDKVVSFGHDDPIASESDIQPLNKTGDIISTKLSEAGIKTEDSTLTQLGKAAVGGISGYSNFMKKWVSDPLQEIPYSIANLLTLHHPDSPYARQLLKTSLLPESKSTSGNVSTIADMVQHLPIPQNWKGEVQQRLMGAVPAGEEAVRGLVTPENIALAGTAAGIPAAARPITAAFLANTAAATPQAVNQAIQTERNPQATQAEKGSADVNAAANIAFAALLAAHMGKGEAPRTDIPTTAERLDKDKTFGDVPLAQPHLPTDQILDTRTALPETAGPSVPQQTRFQAGPPGAEAPIDRSQLSPQEQVELDRGPAPVYTPPKEKVMGTPIIGEQHPLQQPITDLTSAIADLKAQLEKGQIVPASQAVKRAREVEGGKVSFGATAASEGIPNAQQSALQPKESVVPAVNVNGDIITGRVGETHDQLLQSHGIDPRTIPHEDSRRGFVGSDSKFLSRIEAERATGLVGTARAGGLDSMDLPGAKNTFIKERSQENTQGDFDQQKAKLVAQLKTEPTMEGKQKVWKQIEGLKNSRPQESQQVEITLPGLRVKLDAAAKRRQAQGGGIDMSILEDIVKYGKTLYTKGMDQAAWAQEAVKKLGENVRPYIDEAYKYIAPSMQQRGDKLFGMQAEDVLRNPLDLKLKPDTKGEFDAGQLVGRTLNTVNPTEKQFLEDAGIRKEFPPGGRVSAERVQKWIEDNGPKVEVRKFGDAHQVKETDPHAEKRTRIAEIRHGWIDALPVRISDEIDRYVHAYKEDPESADTSSWHNQYVESLKDHMNDSARRRTFINRIEEYARLKAEVPPIGWQEVGGRASWSSISPKPESEMPGYVEGAVVVPKRVSQLSYDELKKQQEGMEDWQRRDHTSGELFPSTHSFPPNTLGFFRGYMDKTPEGKKVFHVVEVQSDWAQRVRDYKEKLANNPAGDWDAERGLKNSDHPLLKDWSRLTLKAAINHAIKEGADEVAVQDAESAMMMEGHDQQVPRTIWHVVNEHGNQVGVGANDTADFNTATAANNEVRRLERINPNVRYTVKPEIPEPSIPQEHGMRLNYDRILPQILGELTGEKGKQVEFGEHKMAFDHNKNRDYEYEFAVNPQTGERINVTGDLQKTIELRDAGWRFEREKANLPIKTERENLIFRNPDGTPKTTVTAHSFDLSKVKESMKTKPFSYFGSDKPKVPSVEQVQQRLQPKASIGKGIQAAVDKNKQAGSVTLPSKEEMGKALKTATEAPKKILDTLFGHGVDRPMSEIIDHFAAKQAGWSVPRHVSANEEVGNKLVKFAHADIAADEYAKALASEVLGDKHYKDKAFQDKLGKVIVEERLRALAKYHQGRDEADIANSVNHVMTPIEFNKALADPEIKAALKRHKDTLQPVAEEQHTALGGKLAATGPETGAFANLLAVTDADSFETAKQLIYRGKGNINPNAAIKGSVFDKRATGNAPKYETNYRTVAERMISGNYKRNALRNWIDSGVEAGLYKYGKTGEAPPEMGGQQMVSVPVKIKSTPWGSQTVKNLWVRKDLLPEVEQALSGGGKPMRAGLQHLLDLATTAQIIGPTDFVFHTANMFSSIVGSLGAKTVTADLARKITGVKQLDALGRIGYHLYRAILDHPDVQKELASLAQIGALRDQRVHEGPLGQFTTGSLIQLIDKAGRLARNQMFDNLVERKWVNDTELDRREFVNKMGQYNSKLMSKFQSTFQQYTSQFVVAGRTFNRNAFQRVLMSNEVRAANPSAYAKMKALNMIGVASTLIAIPIAVNSILTGHPFGRPGTPVGKIDTGKDDEKGRHILIDPAQSELMRRGLRNTGGQALFEGVRENKGVGETAKRMAGDVINGQLHPWMGPPVRIIQAYIEKRAETHDVGQSLKAALAAVNPTITAYFGMDERNPDRKGLAGVGKSLAGAIGVGTSRLPTHQEKVEATAAKYSMPLKTLDDRAEAERKMKQVSIPQTREELSKGAEYSIRADTKRGDLLEKAMDPEDRTFVQRRGLEIPGFSDKLHYAKSIVVLKPDEVERLQSRILAADKSMIAEFRQGYYDKETPEDQKLIFKKMITKGREHARKEMIEELMK